MLFPDTTLFRSAGGGECAGAAGAGAAGLQRLGHGSEHRGVLAHAEVVVRAPDGDALAVVAAVAHRARKAPRHPLEIGENAIAPFATEVGEGLSEELFVIHLGYLCFGDTC